MSPLGASGAGAGVRTAIGRGGGGAFVTLGCGAWGGGGGGGGGSSLGLGGSISSLRISTGITTSAALRINPLCKAQSAATWNSTTPLAMTVLRDRPSRPLAGGGEKRSDTVHQSG